MRFVYNFKNGEYEGELKEWYPNGQMYKDFNYENGYESGMQSAWEINGKLLANYDVKNGRKYGLIGTHNCKSPWDDVAEGENNESSM
jgi:antitoxin component YwqK of YwqJK toxin-antitoxin module